jgi:fructose/tagatose bisphosphate aldolase
MGPPEFSRLLTLLDGSIDLQGSQVEVNDPSRLRATIHRLAEAAALDPGRQGPACYLIRLAALALGIYPASIHDLYMARGRGDTPATFTVPAVNLRALPYDAARAVFRAARSMDAVAFLFEISRAEIGFTSQRPGEYAASILAAAIFEGYQGPVFLQGDHFQISAKRFAAGSDGEVQAVRDLTTEAIAAGFFNIDFDASTLVDLSKPELADQQRLNSQLTAEHTAYIRSREPAGVTISVGGEIGEVGGRNSTEAELRAFMEGYTAALRQQAPGAPGLSKISIQTGTSHGGVALPDGSIAEVNVDFDTMRRLSRIARSEYGMAGAVQHGASTLPESAFGRLVESEAAEIHLATSFTRTLFAHLPGDLMAELHAYLDEQFNSERQSGLTDEQFYHQTRKYAIGPFKARLWGLDPARKAEISKAWEEQFRKLFFLLNLEGTRRFVEQTIRPVAVKPALNDYSGEVAGEKAAVDLAD